MSRNILGPEAFSNSEFFELVPVALLGVCPIRDMRRTVLLQAIPPIFASGKTRLLWFSSMRTFLQYIAMTDLAGTFDPTSLAARHMWLLSNLNRWCRQDGTENPLEA